MECDFQVGDLLMVTGAGYPEFNGMIVECTEVASVIPCACHGTSIGVKVTRIEAEKPHTHCCYPMFTKIQPLDDFEELERELEIL